MHISSLQGYYYARIGNPTRDSLERCLATLDSGKYGLVYPSGLAAATALLHLLRAGEHIVACSELYGGTHLLFSKHAKMQGIELDFVDSTNVKNVASAIKLNTKVNQIKFLQILSLLKSNFRNC